MPSQPLSNDSSRQYFIFGTQRNKIYLASIAIVIIVQFAVFKFFYPFPNFIHGDSFVFLRVAYNNAPISVHPIGYSKFLRFFSVFSTSDLALTAFQYLLIQASALAFVITLLYFYRPGKVIAVFLTATMVFNPLFLHLANLISSDGLFLALSFIWLTLLLWQLHRPTIRLSMWQVIILLIAFTIRYNALYYPVISAVVYILSKQKLLYKLLGISAGFVLIGSFIFFTSLQYKTFIGQQVFSPFSGWQLANNALYAYRRVDSANRMPVPAKFQEIDGLVRTYFDSYRNRLRYPMDLDEASTVYMWDLRSPLQNFMVKKYSLDILIEDTATRRYQRWASAGPFLGEYGSWLIKQYPLKFIENYLWPNAMKYFAPPTEFLELYNMGVNTISPIAQTWFELRTTKVTTRFHDIRANSLDFYPIFSGIVNGLLIVCMIGFCFIVGFKQRSLGQLVIIASALWLFNLIFSVLAAPIALRFQVFPISTSLSISLIVFEFLYKTLSEKERKAVIVSASLQEALP